MTDLTDEELVGVARATVEVAAEENEPTAASLITRLADRIEALNARVGELSQDVINWRVAMGSWVWEAVEECESALKNPDTDPRARRWYEDALTAAKTLADKYGIKPPSPRSPQ